jgi:hypothetical protein
MEVLDVKDSVDGVRAVMKDGVHLTEEAVDRLMDYVVCKVEELYTAKKRGQTGRGETATKRAGPPASVGSYGGYESKRGRGGWMGGSRGGGGSDWGARSNTYN